MNTKAFDPAAYRVMIQRDETGQYLAKVLELPHLRITETDCTSAYEETLEVIKAAHKAAITYGKEFPEPFGPLAIELSSGALTMLSESLRIVAKEWIPEAWQHAVLIRAAHIVRESLISRTAGPGSIPNRFDRLCSELERRFPSTASDSFSSRVAPEDNYLRKIDLMLEKP